MAALSLRAAGAAPCPPVLASIGAVTAVTAVSGAVTAVTGAVIAVTGAVIAVTRRRPGATEPVGTDVTRASLTIADYRDSRDYRDYRDRRDRRRASRDGTPQCGCGVRIRRRLHRRDQCDQRRVSTDGRAHVWPRGRECGDPRVADRSKMSDGHEPQLPGSRSHAAPGARIVPWRQPGDWLIKPLIASA